MSEIRIPREVADKYRHNAAQKAKTGTVTDATGTAGAFERFNAGVDRNRNTADFFPAETNVAGVALEKPRSRTSIEGDFIREVPQKETFSDPSEKTKQTFGAVRYNWEHLDPGKPVTVYLPPYNNRVDDGGPTQMRIAELAEQMPDTPLISFMHPSMGSDTLTSEQKKQLQGKDAYFAIADAQLRILKHLGIDNITVVGGSMGAWAALAVAARAYEHEIKVDHATLISLPGVKEMSVTELGMGMFAAGKYVRTQQYSPFDPYIYESTSRHRSELTQAKNDIQWTARILPYDPFFRYARAMTSDTATDRLRTILSTQPNATIDLIGGTEDSVSPEASIHSVINTLRGEGFDNKQISRRIYPGGTHAVFENPLRHAAAIKSALTGSAL